MDPSFSDLGTTNAVFYSSFELPNFLGETSPSLTRGLGSFIQTAVGRHWIAPHRL